MGSCLGLWGKCKTGNVHSCMLQMTQPSGITCVKMDLPHCLSLLHEHGYVPWVK